MNVKRHGFPKYTKLVDAVNLVISEVDKVGKERVPFEEAEGRVLAEDIRSKTDVPPFDRAAMDGFAVRAEDTFGADENDPIELKEVGSVEVGVESGIDIGEGEAAKIATGAPLPRGANAVVMVEETRRDNSNIEVLAPVSPGKNVSSRGEDVRAGQTVLEAGRRLGPSDIGMLVSTDNLEIEVRCRPKVGISATGGELREAGEDIGVGEIVESNTYSLMPAIRNIGCSPSRLGILPDDLGRIKESLSRASDFDMLIFTGGSSVGEKDYLPEAISETGELVFHGVAMRPGAPIAFGIVHETPVFSLPGFPVAALIAFEMVIKPALLKMQGLNPLDYGPEVRGELSRKVSSSLGRVDVVRVKLSRSKSTYSVEPIRVTGSGILRTMTEADGILVVPEQSEGFSEGEEVQVRLLRYL